jgi:nicotinate-nucleotide--dimethylbenzimidazole phosphoribosyltransferase
VQDASTDASEAVARLASRVRPADEDARAAAVARLAALATPPGALGDLGALAVRLAASTGRVPPPRLHDAVVIVCAGDHGVHARGVSPWPQAVTTAMAATVAGGRAGVSAIAAASGARVAVLDVGMATVADPATGVADANVLRGTRDAAVEDALTRDEAARAVLAGAAAADGAIDTGADLLAVGDLGIANTTTSAVLVGACTGTPAEQVTGRGTGIDDETLARKTEVVAMVLDRVDHDAGGLELLASVGGAEHAALVGVLLAGAARRVPVVLDGVITDAAALVARRLAPDVVDHLVAGHRSTEPGATIALDALGLAPLLDLELRLGEGSGAALAIPLVRAASRLLRDVATLEELGFA